MRGSPPPVPGMDFNDTDYGWFADVFLPMAPILRTTPLLIARGKPRGLPPRRERLRAVLRFVAVGRRLPARRMRPREGAQDHRADVVVRSAHLKRPHVACAVVVDTAGGKNFELSPWVAKQRPRYRDAARPSRPTRARVVAAEPPTHVWRRQHAGELRRTVVEPVDVGGPDRGGPGTDRSLRRP